ncbi:MAG: hypothetical protein COA79_25675 [Planctomycetota bacterium]|nr:MAG: hypothetical protein COA79_25675 [Planctomycetota bacterium]
MTKNTLPGLCEKYGLNQRKHTKEIFGWCDRALTVVNLDEEEKSILDDQGVSALDALLKSKEHFSFPALEITKPRDINLVTSVDNLVIVCPDDIAYLKSFAVKLKHKIEEIAGVQIDIISDQNVDLTNDANLMVLGGNHQNQVSRKLSSDNISYADSVLPGKDGYLIHTLHSLRSARANIFLIAFDETVEEEVLEHLFYNLKERGAGNWEFERMHLSKFAEENKVYFEPKEEAFRELLLDSPISFEEFSPDNTAFKKYVESNFDSGGRDVNNYNLRLVYHALSFFHLWNYTNDQKYLEIYKSIVWGLVEYHLKTPEGASYVSDMDFPLGELIGTWSLAEVESIFNEEERLIITGTLLSIVRQIFRYTKAFWPIADEQIRFNHETFPGMSLWKASNYFGPYYDTEDANEWSAYAHNIFSGPIGKIFKHTENANDYQWLTPMHKIMFDLSSGKMEVIKSKIICKTAYSCVIVTDNFGYAVHYGDAGALLGLANLLGLNLIEIAAYVGDDEHLAWVGELIRKKTSSKILLGCRTGAQGIVAQKIKEAGAPPPFGDWEFLELDDHFREFYQPNFPKKYLLDKIAFRTGWQDEDQYLCFEPQSCSGHMHFDMNSILRYNHLGRVWLVDNGYGRPSGLTNVQQSFNQRQRGPEDHNLVIFRNDKSELVIPPPFCGVIAREEMNDFHLIQSSSCNIDGANWLRTILLLKDTFMLVIDQIEASGSEANIECQFNILGEDKLEANRWSLSQEGVKMFVQFDGRAEVKQDTYLNGTWDETFKQNTYPYAKDNVKKLRRIISKPTRNERINFVSLFEASTEAVFAYELNAEDKNKIMIKGNFANQTEIKTENLTLKSTGDELIIDIKENWLLPDDLTVEMFGDFGERKSKIR